MAVGRPKKEINKELFVKLCGMQCTEKEICDFFETTDKTLSKWCRENFDGAVFSEVYKKYSTDGKISLRRYQLKLAERSPAMAIFLGKQYLGQRDNPDIGDNTEVLELLANLLKAQADAARIRNDDVQP